MSIFSRAVRGTRQPAASMQPVVDPAEWTRESLGPVENFSYHFSDNDRQALIDAVAATRARGVPAAQVSSDNFRIHGALATIMDDVRDELRHGRGLAMLRGFPVDQLDREGSAMGYLGLGSYLGRPMAQNMKGHILGHVKDLGGDYADPKTRGYYTRAEMRIHADPCDYVGLLCLQTAKSGGASCVASSITVYNRILRERPDLAEALVSDFYRSKKGDVNPDEEPFFKQPIFSFWDGYFSAVGAGSAIDKAQGLPGVPPFTPAQREAIEFYRQVAEESLVDIPFLPGDVQFLNNYVALHTRREYEDWPESSRKRHLLRLWLEDPGNRPIPPDQRNGHRRGLLPQGVVLNAPLDVC
ncbi:MAG TPA: TauD/TfdA family dioxygenase [Stellaceae bacterium]|nr:TauD/TfdA family dioxygenase [Stellaceae bacterium]